MPTFNCPCLKCVSHSETSYQLPFNNLHSRPLPVRVRPCQRRVRPNALHITFWSFYDLSISLIVSGKRGLHSATVRPCDCASHTLNRIISEEHLRVKLSTAGNASCNHNCCDCCVLYVYSGKDISSSFVCPTFPLLCPAEGRIFRSARLD